MSGPGDDRLVALIEDVVGDLDLDMTGMRVATEAASGAFAAAPLIAARAGADVIAVGRDSQYGKLSDVQERIHRLGDRLGIRRTIACTDDRLDDRLRGADVVTNSGFLRPLDAALLSHIGAQTVVAYMCEAWEARPGDVNADYCRGAGIPVYFSDEDGWGMGVFSMCGTLAVKLCLEAGCQVVANRIAVLSSDRFGPVISRRLRDCGAHVELLLGPMYEGLGEQAWDAVVVAEYRADETIAGSSVPIETLRQALAPGGAVIQFAGSNDTDALASADLSVYPPGRLPPHRMARTLAHLGPLPVVRLSAIGLKVGWAACEARRRGLARGELDRFVLDHSPAQLPVLTQSAHCHACGSPREASWREPFLRAFEQQGGVRREDGVVVISRSEGRDEPNPCANIDYASRAANPMTTTAGEWPYYRDAITRAAEALPCDAVVIDLGCGDGRVSLELLRRWPLKAVSIDLDEANLSRLAARVPADQSDRWLGCLANAKTLRLPEGAAHAVFAMGLLHTLPADAPTVLKEIHRALRPGGVLVNSEATVEGALLYAVARRSVTELQRVAGTRTKTSGFDSPNAPRVAVLEPAVVQHMLEGAGFAVEARLPVSVLPSLVYGGWLQEQALPDSDRQALHDVVSSIEPGDAAATRVEIFISRKP